MQLPEGGAIDTIKETSALFQILYWSLGGLITIVGFLIRAWVKERDARFTDKEKALEELKAENKEIQIKLDNCEREK